MESKTEFLRMANWCPGCADHPDLPETHLCTGVTKVGPIKTISLEQSRAIDEILPFIPLELIERVDSLPNSLIPLLRGEIIMQNQIIRTSITKVS